MLVDYDPPGSAPLAVHLRVPRALAGGGILRLTAPSPAATTGTRLGGQAVAAERRVDHAKRAARRVTAARARYRCQIDPSSAAVVTLTLRRHLGRAAREN